MSALHAPGRARIVGRRAAALALLGAALACARAPLPGSAAAPPVTQGAPAADLAPVADSTVVVALHRAACFGNCPTYELTITRGGAVTIEGRGQMAARAPWRTTLGRAAVDELLRTVEESGFFALRDRYAPGEPGCDRAATDHPWSTVRVSAGGRTKTIEHYHGCLDAPAVLTTLEARIDEVAGTRRWLPPER